VSARQSALFRPLAPGDADLLAALHKACFKEDWTASAARLLLGVPGTWGVLAYAQETGGPDPFGYCIVRGARDELEILNIGILPDLRRRGLGRSLLHAVLREAGSCGAAACSWRSPTTIRPARDFTPRRGSRRSAAVPDTTAGRPTAAWMPF